MLPPISSMQATAALWALLTLGSTISAAPTTARNSSCLPVVDLGYELHRALWHNKETDIYKFQNIRYAQEPKGDLRFRAPVHPKTDRSVIRLGSDLKICPQGRPDWQGKAYIPIAKYSNPKVPFTLDGWKKDLLNSTSPPGDINANATEDCLLLDVHVPKKVFDQAALGTSAAPVLVWVHGGGYVFGSKDASGATLFDPAGIIAQARKTYGEEFVFVGLNYRLGALGFLSGPEVERDGAANAGLLDQRFALEWVQDNIHLFGGSKDDVTVMGESAGGASIFLHLAARDRKGRTPFKQVIAQSPGMIPELHQGETIFYDFMDYLNVTSLQEARDLDSKAIIEGNFAHIGAAPTTTYIYGPTRDGDYVTESLVSALKNGNFDKSVKTLVAHNIFEGAFFFDPTVETDDEFGAWLERSLPGLDEERKSYIMDSLYPSVFDGSLGYVDQSTRGMKLQAEAVIDCNFHFAGRAKSEDGYAYEFGVSPGMHIQDLAYTFGNDKQPAPYPDVQHHMQLAIASFVLKGVPLREIGEEFPVFGDDAMVVNITSDGTAIPVPSKVNQTRCDWWANFS